MADKFTYPSTQVAIVDIPETDFLLDGNPNKSGIQPSAYFVYNFYTDDESVNDSAIAPAHIRSKYPDFISKGVINDADVIDKITKFIPRFVELRFKPIEATFGPGDPDDAVERLLKSHPHLIADNLDKVYREELFSNGMYTGIVFSDSSLDQKIFTALSATLAQDFADQNAKTNEKLVQTIEEFSGINVTEFSLLDNAKFLNETTSELVDADFIAEGLNNIKTLASTYISDDEQKERIRHAFARAQRSKLGVQLNDKFVWTTLNGVVNDKLSTYNDDISQELLNDAKLIQDGAIQQFVPGEIFENEYDIALNSIIEPISLSSTNNVVAGKVIGYIIDKVEIDDVGNVIVKPPIVIENNNISRTVDLNVAYGRTYMYSIRSVALLFLNATADDVDNNVRIAILASSRNSSYKEIRTFEAVPPPAPADFGAIWDHASQRLRLMWAFPVNKQRDISRFQIFRRASVAEPFELLAELDFDKSVQRYENFEDVGNKRIRMNTPRTWFEDNKFNKQSSFIYALCSIDAHGLSSNYSAQLQITYNGLEHRLNIKQVSAAGAPKQYPNMLVPVFLTENVMKDSGHDKVHIYFDPEIINAVDVNGNDFKLIAKDGNAKYRLSLINLDLQQSEGVDIIIDDLQTTTDA